MMIRSLSPFVRAWRALLLLALLVWLTASPSAQPAPPSLPEIPAGAISYLGRFTAPTHDGVDFSSAHALGWGTSGIGMAADGVSIWVACHDHSGGAIARISIPALGQVARVLEPCRPLDLRAVNPSSPNQKAIGGALAYGGRLIVTGYDSYDGNGASTASHFAGAPGAFGAPVRLSVDPGLAGGYMGIVPPEWRAVLGGPAMTGLCCVSIMSRSSYGPALSIFNPDTIGTVTPAPAAMVLGYPDAHQTIGGFTSVGNLTGYGMATTIAGVAFPANTSSVLFVGRQGTAACYGTGTDNKALHNTPDGQGNIYCYDPGNSAKGTHGYPYILAVWTYRAADLVEVKAGRKAPWDVRPVRIEPLPGAARSLKSATYDPATRRIIGAAVSGDTPEFHVWEVAAPGAPPVVTPAPVSCAGTWSPWARVAGSESVCIAGSRTYAETRAFTVTTPASQGGAACPASPETRTLNESCTPAPPAPPVTVTIACRVTSAPAGYADGDVRRYIRCDTNGPTADLPVGAAFSITVPKR